VSFLLPTLTFMTGVSGLAAPASLSGLGRVFATGPSDSEVVGFAEGGCAVDLPELSSAIRSSRPSCWGGAYVGGGARAELVTVCV
jgi:hypothetical protein